ncbi:hypothetical protein C8Q75DRAFT_803223 [Abortiporus biennis]|nr:hypothetical protein C8Q75DRAFT_803223 [Abortiporus biennis]
MSPMTLFSLRSVWLVFLILSVQQVSSEWVNRTIDDQEGDQLTGRQVSYSPTELWTQGATCGNCAFHPSTSMTYDGTWHDGSRTPQNDVQPLEFSFKFNGTAVYVYSIAVRLTLTDVNFTLDGTFMGRYTEFYNVTDQYLFNAPMFALDSIPYGEHTLVASAFGPNDTLVYFDYALYTTNTSSSDPFPDTDVTKPLNATTSFSLPYPTPVFPANIVPSTSTTTSPSPSNTESVTSGHKTNVGAIVGGVVGGVAFIVALLAVFFLYRRHRRPQAVTPIVYKSGLLEPDEAPTESKSRGIFVGVVPQTSAALSYTPSSNATTATSADPPSSDANPPIPVSKVDSSYGTDVTSSTDDLNHTDASSLREQVRILRADLEAMRRSNRNASTNSPTTVPSPSSGSGNGLTSTASSPSKQRTFDSETQKEETQQNPASAPDTANLLREMAIIRGEIAELRMQQELIQIAEPLPEYTPPPPRPSDRRVLPQLPPS